MFGKTGVFCDGLMFGMETDDTLYFRVDDHNRATAYDVGGGHGPIDEAACLYHDALAGRL